MRDNYDFFDDGNPVDTRMFPNSIHAKQLARNDIKASRLPNPNYNAQRNSMQRQNYVVPDHEYNSTSQRGFNTILPQREHNAGTAKRLTATSFESNLQYGDNNSPIFRAASSAEKSGYTLSQNDPTRAQTRTMAHDLHFRQNAIVTDKIGGFSANNQPMIHNLSQLLMQGPDNHKHVFTADDTIYLIRFKHSRHYFRLPQSLTGLQLTPNTHVIVDADRGTDLGVVVEVLPAEQFWTFCLASKSKVLPGNVIGIATADDIASMTKKTADEAQVTRICQEVLLTNFPLPIQIIDAEYQFDRKKLTLYYISPVRNDFRAFVRYLYSLFKVRIWMQKIEMKENASSAVHFLSVQDSSNTSDLDDFAMQHDNSFSESDALSTSGANESNGKAIFIENASKAGDRETSGHPTHSNETSAHTLAQLPYTYTGSAHALTEVSLQNELASIAAKRDELYRQQQMQELRLRELQEEEKRIKSLQRALLLESEQSHHIAIEKSAKVEPKIGI